MLNTRKSHVRNVARPGLPLGNEAAPMTVGPLSRLPVRLVCRRAAGRPTCGPVVRVTHRLHVHDHAELQDLPP